MTSMSALQSTMSRSAVSSSTSQYAASSRVSSDSTQAQSASTSQSSTIVTLGTNNQNLAIDPTYSVSAPIWKVRSNDAVSTLMGGNFFSSSLSSRLQGLGSALLGMLKDGTDSFTQSVSLTSSEAGAVTSTGTQQTSYPAAEIKLQIRTQSGVDVSIVLGSENDRLQVQMQSSGDLSEAERTALGDLSKAFQSAIDGMSANPPALNLSGLTKFDTKVLSSVDFQSSVTLDKDGPQKLAFHADSTTRSVNVDGPLGSMDVSVDMRDSSIWGNAKQRAAAIDSYLKQFDKAASRGNADKSLVGMFKDAFSQMNSDYVAPSQQPKISLADVDHAMLTGLADFKASVKEVTTSPNPKNLSEVDSFAYDASQTTQVGGINQFNRSISQQQQSNLKASYHMSLVPDVPLILTSDNKSQNYYYKQIDDTAQSKVGISYTKGVLSEAYAEQSAKQSTRTSKYELGVLTDDATTPFNASQKRDILASLKPLLDDLKNERPSALYNWQQKLLEVHSEILLKSDPADLKEKGWTTPVSTPAST